MLLEEDVVRGFALGELDGEYVEVLDLGDSAMCAHRYLLEEKVLKPLAGNFVFFFI